MFTAACFVIRQFAIHPAERACDQSISFTLSRPIAISSHILTVRAASRASLCSTRKRQIYHRARLFLAGTIANANLIETLYKVRQWFLPPRAIKSTEINIISICKLNKPLGRGFYTRVLQSIYPAIAKTSEIPRVYMCINVYAYTPKPAHTLSPHKGTARTTQPNATAIYISPRFSVCGSLCALYYYQMSSNLNGS